MEINLISDTVTKPCESMIAAMINAKVGDDVFKEDPTVNKLEKKLSDMFGMESALFFPPEPWQIRLQLKFIQVLETN